MWIVSGPSETVPVPGDGIEATIELTDNALSVLRGAADGAAPVAAAQ
jgi:hypothetical protein